MIRDLTCDDRGHEELQRWGRGVSYHEIDLTLGDVRALDVVGSYRPFMRRREFGKFLKFHLSADRRWRDALRAQAPGVPNCFFEPFLDLMIRRT